MKAFKFEEKEVLIANANCDYHSIRHICTHKRGELSKGTLEGTTVTCPQNRAKFDDTTGKVIS